MKVAVCDDLKENLLELECYLKQIPYVKQISLFSDMALFYEEVKEGEIYDAVLMDFEWNNNKNGIDFAEELYSLCPYSKIIYVTAYSKEYVEEALLRTPNLSGLLIKPVNQEFLVKNLDKIEKNKQDTEGKLVVRFKGNISVIPYEDICYIESQLHKSNIVLKNKEYQCTERLSQLKLRLNEQFLECHKSYLVNMDHISGFSNNGICLDCGKIVPVSKKRYSEAKAKFFEYIAGRM